MTAPFESRDFWRKTEKSVQIKINTQAGRPPNLVANKNCPGGGVKPGGGGGGVLRWSKMAGPNRQMQEGERESGEGGGGAMGRGSREPKT